jgi:hypothetical protein
MTREYRLKGRYRHFYFGLGLFLALLGLGLGGVALPAHPKAGFQPVVLGFGIALLLLGGLMMLSMWRLRYVLSRDAIERHGLFGVNRLERDDIAGRRLIPVPHGPPMIRLDSRRSRRAMSIHVQLQTDEHLTAWLQSLPDIDQQEMQSALDAYLQPDEDGSPEQKREKLRAVFRVAQALNGIAIALLFWAMLYPHPYAVVLWLNALLPVVVLAVAMWGGPACTLNPGRNDVRVGLLVPWVLPGGALAMRAILDNDFLDWQEAVRVALLATMGFMFIAWLLVRSLRAEGAAILTLALLMTAYGYGASALVNRQLDRGEPEVFTTQVMGKHVSSGKATTYYLELAPWGPRSEAEDVDSGRSVYERVRKGDTVCVYLWPGALGMRQFAVAACRS